MNKPAITFSDEISDNLRKLAMRSPESLDNVLYSILYTVKQEVIRKMQSVFHEHSGKMRKGIQYKRMRSAFFKLKAPTLASVYEYNGANVKATGKALRFEIDGQVYYRPAVRIEPRPFFYPGIRHLLATGQINRIAEREIKRELEKVGLRSS